MLFGSLEFAIFLPVVFTLYWSFFQRSLRAQNFFVVVASYVFYGWWDWRFLFLIFLSTLVDYTAGLGMASAADTRKRRMFLATSLISNLGMLGLFKYYDFFVENFSTAFTILGVPMQGQTLGIILPVGISFYTFQTLSYTIDVYRGNIKPTRDFISFAAFVSFFPQLVAGPIERATHLLPQFQKSRTFDPMAARDGLRQILWGLFKKLVIADRCALIVNAVFADPSSQSGSTMLLGVLFFAFQIYGDFSGYSDIAIGTSRLFGFSLMQNFAYPYFSRDMGEFWRRWHISLSTWFRDYLYIPLGGSRVGRWKIIRNTFAIFLVSGFWHGANWTFLAWGFLNALYFLPLLATKRNRKHLDIVAEDRILPSVRELAQMGTTFCLTSFAWVFFRAESIGDAFVAIRRIASPSLLSMPTTNPRDLMQIFVVIIPFIILEWAGRRDKHALEKCCLKYRRPVRWGFYYLIVMAIILFMPLQKISFIYFQF